jgi:hypothetical protein
LLSWKLAAPYNQPKDWVFASTRMKGKQPYSPDSLLKRSIRPAAARAKIAKHIGWHTCRRTFTTLLKANGEDIKVVLELLRHATIKMTLEIYAQAITPAKREAQSRVAGLFKVGAKSEQVLFFSIFSTLKTDPLNGSGRRLRSFEWRFGPPFSEVRSSYLPRLHRLSHEPRLCRCAERKPRNLALRAFMAS